HIVSQTIYQYLSNGETVYLDISMITNFQTRFPSITKMCIEHGIDLQKGLLPVAPGSHFLMGGIDTDLFGRTSVNNLYAIGEAACTGFHGANRLASNSLLEGLYMGNNLANLLREIPKSKVKGFILEREESDNTLHPIFPEKEELQHRMMANVGIVRNEINLQNQLQWLERFGISDCFNLPLENRSIEEIEKYFMLVTSWLITRSALERKESRGGHFRSDYPEENDEWVKKKVSFKRELTKEKPNESIEIAQTIGSVLY
ncbi:UNVERIFIED_CONTAM: FAD-binding protein, partial [Escherichia coli]